MWLTHLPGHHLTLLASYINCSYLTCSSLVCISNKIPLFAPLLASEHLMAWLMQGMQDCIQGQSICWLVIARTIAITPLMIHMTYLHSIDFLVASYIRSTPRACPSSLCFCPHLFPIRRTSLDIQHKFGSGCKSARTSHESIKGQRNLGKIRQEQEVS